MITIQKRRQDRTTVTEPMQWTCFSVGTNISSTWTKQIIPSYPWRGNSTRYGSRNTISRQITSSTSVNSSTQDDDDDACTTPNMTEHVPLTSYCQDTKMDPNSQRQRWPTKQATWYGNIPYCIACLLISVDISVVQAEGKHDTDILYRYHVIDSARAGKRKCIAEHYSELCPDETPDTIKWFNLNKPRGGKCNSKTTMLQFLPFCMRRPSKNCS